MNILCVDGDFLQLTKLRRDIRRIVPNAHIVCCRNPDKAMKRAKEKSCDILITGTGFAGFRRDGFSLAEEIMALNPQTDVILISEQESYVEAYRAYRVFASDFIVRPYEKCRLAEAFRKLRYASLS